MLKNAHLVAKIRFDAADNEPIGKREVSRWFRRLFRRAGELLGELAGRPMGRWRAATTHEVFPRLVLSSIDADRNEKWRIFQHFSKSTRIYIFFLKNILKIIKI